MIYELGHVALILALTMALAQSVLPLIGAHTGNAAWMGLARPSARGQFLFMLIKDLDCSCCVACLDQVKCPLLIIISLFGIGRNQLPVKRSCILISSGLL